MRIILFILLESEDYKYLYCYVCKIHFIHKYLLLYMSEDGRSRKGCTLKTNSNEMPDSQSIVLCTIQKLDKLWMDFDRIISEKTEEV